MGLTRTANRSVRELHNFLLSRAHTPFEWGKNDCALFAADAVKAMTGTDIAAEFRGKYSDQGTALKAISVITKTGKTVEDAAAYCAVKAGMTELVQPLFAQRGDLVIINDTKTGLIAGIVHLNGRHVAVAGENGIRLQSIKNIKRAWRVG